MGQLFKGMQLMTVRDPETGKTAHVFKPNEFIQHEIEVDFPKLGAKGEIVPGTDSFMWGGIRVYGQLYKRKLVFHTFNPEVKEMVLDANGAFVRWKLYDYTQNGVKMELPIMKFDKNAQNVTIQTQADANVIAQIKETNEMKAQIASLTDLVKQLIPAQQPDLTPEEIEAIKRDPTILERLKALITGKTN